LKNKQMTIVDVAKAAGVSIATVSNVLNRRNVPLAEETILKVEKAAKSLGYRRNTMAASLSRKKTFELGLVLPGFGGYYGDFAQVMQDIVHQCGYHLSVYSSSGQPELEKRHLETLLQRRVDGLFCHGLAMSADLTRQFVGEGTPLVLFNAWNWPEDVALGAVNLDFADGSAQAVRHLAERGCRSLFYISKESAKTTDIQRRIGFLRGIGALEKGVCLHHEIVTYVNLKEEAPYAAITGRLQEGEPVGVLAFDDLDALVFISRLQELDYRVPGQIKIVGINNMMFAQYNWPSITSLAIDIRNQALHAVHLLLGELGELAALASVPLDGLIAYRLEGCPAHELHIPMRLIERMSTQ